MSNDKSDTEAVWYFDFQSKLGFTKHLGGAAATRELAELCHFGAGKRILNVGSGAGVSACYIAKNYDCRVVGVDVLDKMVEQAIKRAVRLRLIDKLEFRVADAQDLPFDDNTFDAVISESVNTFLEDKQKGLREYIRVTKPGGYVGFNEAVWLRLPPADTGESFAELAGQEVLAPEFWESLIKNAGLQEVVINLHEIDMRSEAVNQIKLIGIKEYLGVLGNFLKLIFNDPTSRQFIKAAMSTPKELIGYIGYGIYAGQKPA